MSDRFPTDNAPDSGPDLATHLFGEPISVYTRAQAVADGILVDVTPWASSGPDGMVGGFRVPVAITRALWAVIDIDRRDTAAAERWRKLARDRGESTRGRAHDVLWLAAVAACRPPDRDAVHYHVLMTVEGTGGGLVRKTLRLDARIDADGVTIGFPEDF